MARPIAILGMHRSNTSMAATMLGDLGIDLGPPEEMLPPAADNPEGFGEDRRFMAINDELLEVMGGSWELPPELPDGWPQAPQIRPIEEKARELIQMRESAPVWAWKDPRTCLTIEFWQRLLPNLTIIHCLREPFKTAQSLLFRESVPLDVGLQLWLTYNSSVERHSTEENSIVTHSASYFEDCQSELDRVVGFLSLSPAPAAVEMACRVVRPVLSKPTLLEEFAPPEEVRKLYERLCARAGPVFQNAKNRGSSRKSAADPDELIEGLREMINARAKHNYETVLGHRMALRLLKLREEQLALAEEHLDRVLQCLADLEPLSKELDRVQKTTWFRIGRRLKRL